MAAERTRPRWWSIPDEISEGADTDHVRKRRKSGSQTLVGGDDANIDVIDHQFVHQIDDVVVGRIAAPPSGLDHPQVAATQEPGGVGHRRVEDHRDVIVVGSAPLRDALGEAFLGGGSIVPPTVRTRAVDVVAVDDPAHSVLGLERHEEIAGVDTIPDREPHVGHDGRCDGDDLVFHLHRLDDHQQLPLGDPISR